MINGPLPLPKTHIVGEALDPRIDGIAEELEKVTSMVETIIMGPKCTNLPKIDATLRNNLKPI